MNNVRRKQIDKVLSEIEILRGAFDDLKEAVGEIRDEEQEYLDNIPENLQASERYELAEEAVSNLDSAYDLLDELDFDELTSYLEEAKA